MDLTADKFVYIWYGWFGVSLGGLGFWLYRSQWGRSAFQGAPEQRHRLGGFDVLFVVMVYFVTLSLQVLVLPGKKPQSEVNPDKLYLGLMAGQLLVAAVILYIGRLRFSGGLAGFGWSLKRPGRTAGWTIIYFVIASGLTLIMLQITLWLCKAAGYDQVQKHETLQRLMENPPGQSTMLLVLTAVVGAPLMEELLFRGMIQTYLIRFSGWAVGPMKSTSLLDDEEAWESPAASYRWLGILTAGILFALSHDNWQHQPALLVLGVFLGYIYERRKNLLMPILVHGMFNVIPVLGALMGG